MTIPIKLLETCSKYTSPLSNVSELAITGRLHTIHLTRVPIAGEMVAHKVKDYDQIELAFFQVHNVIHFSFGVDPVEALVYATRVVPILIPK